jgi:hypothetical protein
MRTAKTIGWIDVALTQVLWFEQATALKDDACSVALSLLNCM